MTTLGDALRELLGSLFDAAHEDPVQRARFAIALHRMQQAGAFRAIDEAVNAPTKGEPAEEVERCIPAHKLVFTVP